MVLILYCCLCRGEHDPLPGGQVRLNRRVRQESAGKPADRRNKFITAVCPGGRDVQYSWLPHSQASGFQTQGIVEIHP